LGDLGLKSTDGYGKNVAGEDGDSKFAKQVCLGVGNLAKEECKTKFGVDGSEKELSSTRSNVGTSRENITFVVANLPDASKEALTLFRPIRDHGLVVRDPDQKDGGWRQRTLASMANVLRGRRPR
jgi:hypothetical protein